MQYTLDSITHVEACLKQEFKEKEIDIVPVMFSDLGKINTGESLFFGWLTNGENGGKVKLLNKQGNDIICVKQNSQINSKGSIS